MYKKRLLKQVMAVTLALTMLLTPLMTSSVSAEAEVEGKAEAELIPESEAERDAELTSESEAETEDGNIPITEEYFPDEVFRNYLSENVDSDKDGSLSQEERNARTEISLTESGVTTLKGIEYFTELTELSCYTNELTNLDVSKNTKLTYLNCYDNQLTKIDISKNTELTNFSCGDNEVTSLDVSKNTKLTYLNCYNNQLTELDVSKNTELGTLNCYGNQLTKIDISKNTKLKTFKCHENELTSLDVSGNTELKILCCSDNQLTSLKVDLNTNLQDIACDNNYLTELDVSKNTKLTELSFSGNELTSLNVNVNTELTWLDCDNNELKSLDVSKNTKLEYLYCSSNHLTSLDVSKNTSLRKLECNENALPYLDISGLSIISLACNDNSYYVSLNEARQYDLSSISGLDVTKISGLVGGEISDTILTVNKDTDTVTYSYTCKTNTKATFTLKEFKAIKKIMLNCTSANLKRGKTLQLIETIEPDEVTNPTVIWSTSNEKVATVSTEGKVTAVGAGTAVIICAAEDDSDIKAECTVVVTNPVTGIILNKTSENLSKGGTLQLTATVTPSDASNQTVIWSTSNSDVATVSTEGKVTAVGVGNATITCAAADDSGVTATCKVTVKSLVTQLTLNQTTAMLIKGKTLQLTANVTPSDASNQTVDWSTSNSKVATVDASGKVTAVGDGSATITCTAKDGSGVTAVCEITVKTLVTQITLNQASASVLKGKSLQLKATITPSDASNLAVTWSTSNSDVATVSTEGKVTAVGVGNATITCTAQDGSDITATCRITVKTPVTKLTLNKTQASLSPKETLQLKVTVTPSNASSQAVTWKSSNTQVATVSSNGKVTAVGDGSATITCTAKDGSGVTAVCEITVKTPVTQITLNQTSASVLKGKSLQLKATITPSDASNPAVTWSTSNSKIATVSTNGKVTAKAVGSAVITCTAKDGSGMTAACRITVKTPVTKLTLNKTQASLSPKETLQLKVTVTPSNASSQAVSWKSSNTKVATVNSSGKVTAKKAGTVTITCTAKDGSGITATCKITVYTNTEAFVARIYTKALNRTAEEAGLKYWTEEINSGRKTPVEVAESFFFAPEFTNKKLSNSEYVKVLYRTFMGREYDKDGLNYWVTRLNHGESRKSVLESFAGCQEFQNIVKSFGL